MGVYDINGNDLLTDSVEGLRDILPNRVLIWHDEFTEPKIDPNKWGNVYSVAYAKDLETVTETGDGITIFSIRDNRGPNMEFSSPYLTTKNLFEFRYGRIEGKMKFPPTIPYHSTLWMLGACYDRISVAEGVGYKEEGVLFPSCGEIDIAEDLENGEIGAFVHWSTEGFDTGMPGYQTVGLYPLTDTPTEWHIYACEWTETDITFYVDGVQKLKWNTSNANVNGWNPFNAPHFIILNCLPTTKDPATWDVSKTEIKWVRVYAPAGTQKVVETSISIPATASISVGERHWLGTPTFTPSNPSDMTVKWKSHNEDIVTCYGGMLIGISAGTTYVQAKSKHGYTALCKVTVS